MVTHQWDVLDKHTVFFHMPHIQATVARVQTTSNIPTSQLDTAGLLTAADIED